MTSLGQESLVNPWRFDFGEDVGHQHERRALEWAKAYGRQWQAGWEIRRCGGVARDGWRGLPRDWVTAPGRSFTGPWDTHLDRSDITEAQRHQSDNTRSFGVSTATQQAATPPVQRQTQHIEQAEVTQNETSSQPQHARRSWAGVMKAARARVKSFNKASTEEVRKKPIATIGFAAAVVALVYTVASHAN